MSIPMRETNNRIYVRLPHASQGSLRGPFGGPRLRDGITHRFGINHPAARSPEGARTVSSSCLDNCVLPLTQKEAALRGRIGGYMLHATHDSREIAARARAGFEKRFLEEVDPDNILPEPERLRRAECARKAHFQRLALKSATARRERAEKQARRSNGRPGAGGATDGNAHRDSNNPDRDLAVDG